MSLGRSVRLLPRVSRIRNFSTTPNARQPSQSIPYTPTCPAPTCACASTPADLEIDRKSPLLHTMAPYTEHLLICTGKEDWTSRIEDEQSPSGDFVRNLRGEIGRGSKAFDPFTNVLMTASSFPASTTPDTTDVLLFPTFKRINSVPNTSAATFASAYLKARTLHPAHQGLSRQQKAALTRDESLASALPAPEPVTTPTVLICGHGGRDKRCGVLGPILQSAFRQEFGKRGIDANVGLISHVGGHKFAGNIIIYLPPNMEENALKGSGVWYGRVGPENVQGVVEETVIKGKIITEMLRGGILRDGRDLARALESQLGAEGLEHGALKLKPRARG